MSAPELRPIECAPRDGSRFLGLVEDDLIAMFWHPAFDAFVSSFRRMTMAPGYTINGEPFKDHSPTIHEPLFWTELPVPPSGGAGVHTDADATLVGEW